MERYHENKYQKEDGTVKQRPNVEWLINSFVDCDEKEKAESSEAVREYIMEYMMTREERDKYYPDIEIQEHPLYWTLRITEYTLGIIKFRLKEMEDRVEKIEKYNYSEKERRTVYGRRDAFAFLLELLKKRKASLKRKIAKLEKDKETINL